MSKLDHFTIENILSHMKIPMWTYLLCFYPTMSLRKCIQTEEQVFVPVTFWHKKVIFCGPKTLKRVCVCVCVWVLGGYVVVCSGCVCVCVCMCGCQETKNCTWAFSHPRWFNLQTKNKICLLVSLFRKLSHKKLGLWNLFSMY